MIDDCLSALATQPSEISAEVIVADAMGKESNRLIKEKFPWVKLLSFTKRLTIPELRVAGFALSKGEIIVVIEDHEIPDRHWYEQMIATHHAHPDIIAVGGAIENGSGDRLIDWSVFFCEYCDFMLPLAGGVVEGIPGNNVSYKRCAFEDIDDLDKLLNQGFWETTLHRRLQARGEKFYLEPSILVHHKKHFGFFYFLSQRYHYSRYYAGTVFWGSNFRTRLIRSVASLALPPLLFTRIVSCVISKRRHLKELALSAPIIFVFTIVWAIGEAVGSLAGPGQSLNRVE